MSHYDWPLTDHEFEPDSWFPQRCGWIYEWDDEMCGHSADDHRRAWFRQAQQRAKEAASCG